MSPFETFKTLPDIALEQKVTVAGTLDWVGMSHIEIPVRVCNGQGESWLTPAHAEAYVNLSDPMAKGIHMSRLFLTLDEVLSQSNLTPALIRKVLQAFLRSHLGISNRSFLRLNFDFMMRRPSLKSGLEGWRKYPVVITAVDSDNEVHLELSLSIVYSSTCPCSAALARQVAQEEFSKKFGGHPQVDFHAVRNWLGSEQGMPATPHSQRSVAEVKVRLAPDLPTLPLARLIDVAERALQTVVQTVVKREDEQQFARINAENLMFCEDAARKLKAAFDKEPEVLDFWIRANHLESLHPHDAVSIATKGLPGGFTAS